MADFARDDAPDADAPDADASAPGKRDIEQTADPQAEPPKRARTSDSVAEPAPQQEEDAAPFSRGVAVAEKQIMEDAEGMRAVGLTELADAIEETIVTTAAQREAALVPRAPPENESGAAQRRRRMFELEAESLREDGQDVLAAAFRSLTRQELTEFNERLEQYSESQLCKKMATN
jgi:hypothetical protein